MKYVRVLLNDGNEIEGEVESEEDGMYKCVDSDGFRFDIEMWVEDQNELDSQEYIRIY